MISRRRARETPRIYSSCIRTHTSILHINRCIYDVARDTTTLRRRRVLQFRSSPFSSLLFSFLSFSFSLPLSPRSVHGSVPRWSIDLIQIQTRSPEFHPLLSFSLSFHLFPPPSCPNHRVFASSVSFYPIGTRVSVRAFVAYRPILSLSISFSPTALRSIPFSLSLSPLLLLSFFS